MNNQTFYHGTDPERARRILREGFRISGTGRDGYEYRGGGNLGAGVYITCRWRTALFFNRALLRVSLGQGTRILDASEPHDVDVVAYLRREFGRAIAESSNPLRVLPRNKKLTQSELVALVRYHYGKAWERDWGRDMRGWARWPARRHRHLEALERFTSLLRRYGFHGYGNPRDDNGIVVFSADRVVPEESVAVLPEDVHTRVVMADEADVSYTLDDLRKRWGPVGSRSGNRLATDPGSG